MSPWPSHICSSRVEKQGSGRALEHSTQSSAVESALSPSVSAHSTISHPQLYGTHLYQVRLSRETEPIEWQGVLS